MGSHIILHFCGLQARKKTAESTAIQRGVFTIHGKGILGLRMNFRSFFDMFFFISKTQHSINTFHRKFLKNVVEPWSLTLFYFACIFSSLLQHKFSKKGLRSGYFEIRVIPNIRHPSLLERGSSCCVPGYTQVYETSSHPSLGGFIPST